MVKANASTYRCSSGRDRTAFSHWPGALLLLALCLGGLPLSAQEPDPQLTHHPPPIQVNVREVVVDVTAYDAMGYMRRGEPIRGLKKEDFEVFENGRPQQIRSFQDHAADGQSTSNFGEHGPGATARPGMSVILIDQASLGFELQPYLLSQLTSFLQSAPEGSPIALFALSPRLRVVHAFTTDHAELLAAVRDKHLGIHLLPSPFLQTQDEVDEAKQAPAALRAAAAEHGGSGGQLADQLERLQEGMAQTEAMERTNNTLMAFQQIARYLSGFPGRKSLIWVSSTFTDRPFGLDTEPEPRVKFTADMLVAARVAVYPIDANGLAAPNLTHAAAAVPGVTTGQAAAAALDSARMEASLDRNRTQKTMDEVADRTGGEAFYNSNGIAWAMNRVVEQTSQYYTLVYTSDAPTNASDYAKVVLRLKGHHGPYRLSYKRGYFTRESRALKEGAVDSVALDPFMDLSMPVVSQIGLQVAVKPARNQEATALKTVAGGNRKLNGPLQRYEFSLVIPTHDLTFTSDEAGLEHGDFLLDLGAYNEKGDLVNSSVARYSPSLDAEALKRTQKGGLQLSHVLDLPPGKYVLRSGVYDLHTARVGTVDTVIIVPN